MKKFKYKIMANRFLIATINFLLLTNISAIAQSATAPEANKIVAFPAWAYDTSNYIILGLCAILLITIYVLYKVNIALLHVISPESEIKTAKSKKNVAAEKKPSFLRKSYLKLLGSVPVEKERDILLDHDYDGIKELDNNLPPWWKYGFYLTIVFAVVYLLYYHVSGVGKLQGAEYEEELQIAAQEKAARLLASSDNVNEESVVLLTDADALSKGKETYVKLCVACHLADGGGQVGPNLTDEYWLHGGGIKNVFKTITYGVPTKGMISWQSQLTPKQIQQVSSYILTFKGTTPAAGKEPQGDIWIEETVTKPDSLTTPDSTLDNKTIAAGIEVNK